MYKDPTASFKTLYMTQQKLLKSGNPQFEGLKDLFRGREMMKMLSGEQKTRVLAALKKRQQITVG